MFSINSNIKQLLLLPVLALSDWSDAGGQPLVGGLEWSCSAPLTGERRHLGQRWSPGVEKVQVELHGLQDQQLSSLHWAWRFRQKVRRTFVQQTFQFHQRSMKTSPEPSARPGTAEVGTLTTICVFWTLNCNKMMLYQNFLVFFSWKIVSLFTLYLKIQKSILRSTLSPANPSESVRVERESNNFRWIKFRSPSHLLQLVESLRLSAGVNFLGCNATRWRCWATHCLAPCLHWSHETVQTLMLMTHRVVQRVVMELWTNWATKNVLGFFFMNKKSQIWTFVNSF